MRRHELTDEQFDKIKDFIPGSENFPGVTARNNRLFVNAVIWVFKIGAPWRDLPERFGKWSSVHKRFSRWFASGVFDKISRILFADSDIAGIGATAVIPPKSNRKIQREYDKHYYKERNLVERFFCLFPGIQVL